MIITILTVKAAALVMTVITITIKNDSTININP